MAATKKSTTTKAKTTASSELSMRVIGADGKAAGTITLPASFAVKVNKQLLAQAVRVYLANQREGSAHTKTRGEVEGSTRKIYRQKGTGRARHGGIRAPIFVGGGITFGPKSRTIRLTMPQKMRKAALASALTEQKTLGNLKIVGGLAALEAKTKAMAQALAAAEVVRPTLLVVAKDAAGVTRAARNLAGVDIAYATDLTTYEVLSHKTVLIMKEAVSELRI